MQDTTAKQMCDFIAEVKEMDTVNVALLHSELNGYAKESQESYYHFLGLSADYRDSDYERCTEYKAKADSYKDTLNACADMMQVCVDVLKMRGYNNTKPLTPSQRTLMLALEDSYYENRSRCRMHIA